MIERELGVVSSPPMQRGICYMARRPQIYEGCGRVKDDWCWKNDTRAKDSLLNF